MTLLFLLPSALHLLINPTLAIFKYALINSSLIFFLFSFQVHEKQILIAASYVKSLLLICVKIEQVNLFLIFKLNFF